MSAKYLRYKKKQKMPATFGH